MSKKIEDGLTPQQRYNLKNTRKYTLMLNLNTEKELYNKMESVENKQGYLKELIKKDLEN